MNSVLGEYGRRNEAIWRPVFPFLLSDTESFVPILKLMSIKSMMPSNHLILCSAPPFPLSLNLSSTSESLPVHQLFASGGQSIGASASASVLPMNILG